MNQDFYGAETNFDVILDIPAPLFKETITRQVESLRENQIDYLDILSHKLRELENFHKEDPDKLMMVNSIAMDIYGHVISEISKKFNIGTMLYTDSVADIQNQAECMYRFFIIKFTKGIRRFLYKEITTNKKEYLNDEDICSKRKDVTTIDVRKRIKNKDDIVIISNLNTIVDKVLDKCIDLESISNLDYLAKAASSSNYEAEYLRGQFLSGQMTGEFVNDIFNAALEEGLMGDIRSSLNEQFISKTLKKN